MTCTPGTYISIANKGSGDLEIHMNSEKHCRNIRGGTSSEKLTKYFVKSNSKLDVSVCAAEGTLAFHTVAHHNSFKCMDCMPKFLREMFNDSEVAKRISSAHSFIYFPFCQSIQGHRQPKGYRTCHIINAI
jgi:hypothetical protein